MLPITIIHEFLKFILFGEFKIKLKFDLLNKVMSHLK